MVFGVLAIAIGIALIVLSADKFVDGASSLASHLGMSHFLVGLTIISIGTSAPELLIAAVASFQDSSTLAFGNAVGSNITNIALVLGTTACVSPLIIPDQLIKRELPLLLAVTIGFSLLAIREKFDHLSALILLGLLPLITYWIMRDKVAKPNVTQITERSLGNAITLTASGLTLLLLSSKALVWGATEIAMYFEISELIIGLTIVAVGTSLPELAASATSAFKGRTDLALGTIIGSNFVNFLGVVGLTAFISPFIIEFDVLQRDLPWVICLTFFLCGITQYSRSKQLTRSHGILLILLYLSYLWHIYITIIPIT